MSSRVPFTHIHSHSGLSQIYKPIPLLSEAHKLLSQSISYADTFLLMHMPHFSNRMISYNLIPFECSAPRTVPQTLQSGNAGESGLEEAELDLKLSLSHTGLNKILSPTASASYSVKYIFQKNHIALLLPFSSRCVYSFSVCHPRE